MTASNSVSNQPSIDELPRPDMASGKSPIVDQNRMIMPRRLPKVIDSGRISFGAGFRLPGSL